MRNELWLGYQSGDMAFSVPDYYEARETRYWQDETGRKWRSFGNICWYTNLDIKKRHEEMILVKKYNPNDYPSYDNYSAIEVKKTSDIPFDYSGIMGVPITFMDKYSPEQFEILDMAHRGAGSYKYRTKVYTEADYPNYSDLNATAVYITPEGKAKNVYFRILIRNKHPELPKES